jgi:hypothetical protein
LKVVSRLSRIISVSDGFGSSVQDCMQMTTTNFGSGAGSCQRKCNTSKMSGGFNCARCYWYIVQALFQSEAWPNQ